MATLDYYDDKEGVTADMYVDLESASYITIFEEATHAYKIEDYPEAVRLFNNALDEYYDEIGDCRALCEMPVDLGMIFMPELLAFSRPNQTRGCKILKRREIS